MKDYSVLLTCGEANMVILHDAFDKGYQQGCKDARNELGQNAIDLAHEESDRAYQQGLEDAWKVARKLLTVHTDALMELFDTKSPFLDFSAQEAIAKIKEYEEKHKQDAEIKVGDEVKDKIGYIGIVITDKPSREDEISVLFSEFEQVQLVCKSDLVKTGRHFDQIAEVIEKMRGEE